MFTRRLWPFSVLILALLAATLASAHDASLHKGKPTEGEIVSMDGAKMQLKTAAGPVTVTLSDKTKYEHGNMTVTKSHLKTGERVAVFGTKLATGELVAREVLISPAASDSHHK
jgi:Domain of unknown function (DUF5666)